MPLAKVLQARHPAAVADAGDDVRALVASGRVLVDGAVVLNERALVDPAAGVVMVPARSLKGSAKLGSALDSCGLSVDGRVCVDVGASAGGFTSALLDRGAARVYAVDVGFGQLEGRLRQDARVVCLERVNAASLSPLVVDAGGGPVSLVTVDVSYTPLAVVVPQLTAGLSSVIVDGCVLLALVKPMFELSLGSLPRDDASVDRAVEAAAGGISSAGWSVERTFPSSLVGNNGAVEAWVLARWEGTR